ncbi:MAG TPA: hypothetical protein VNL91_05185 [Thermoanaerobaculia bacterium]|nr:hypothetical protein [Thermoanaerobaculia bacterium]
MPRGLFYGGTAFCLFLALASAGTLTGQIRSGGRFAFVAVESTLGVTPHAGWAILVALAGGVGAAAILLRMAALIAARNLFSALMAVVSVSGAIAALTWVMLLQGRIVALAGESGSDATLFALAEIHLVSVLMLGWFVSLSFLSLRPYFRLQASRFLSALVVLPLPLHLLIIAQELFVNPSMPPLPAASPALKMLVAVLAALFLAISVHCVRHRHLFIEMTNLRELLEGRFDPGDRGSRPVRLGGAAFDS